MRRTTKFVWLKEGVGSSSKVVNVSPHPIKGKGEGQANAALTRHDLFLGQDASSCFGSESKGVDDTQ